MYRAKLKEHGKNEPNNGVPPRQSGISPTKPVNSSVSQIKGIE